MVVFQWDSMHLVDIELTECLMSTEKNEIKVNCQGIQAILAVSSWYTELKVDN